MYEDEDLQEIHEDIQELDTDISVLRRDLNNISASVNGTGENVTLNGTAEARFKKPPLPMGNSEQVQYSGKNLFNAEENLTFSGVKTINVSIPAGTYRLTFESQSHQGEENPYIRFDEANIGMDFDRTLDREIILNTDVSTVYLYSNGYNYVESQGISATINKLMVSIAGGDYEPYVGGTASPNPDYPQEITNVTGDVEVVVQNKNLFDKDNSNILNYYMTSTGTIGASIFDKLFYINCNPSTTYTIQKIIGTSGRFRIGSFANIPSVGDEPNVFVARDNQTTGVITTGVNDKYLAVQYFASDSNEQAILDSIQVEKRQEKTDYIKGRLQTFTFPLGNEKLMLGDYLADDGIHKNRKKIVLDGTSENKFSSFSTGANNRGAITAFSDIKKDVDFRYNTALCTNFAYVPNVYFDSGDTEGFIVDSTGTIYVRFGSQSEINTLAKANQWLANTLPELEYELAEETIIPYTPAQQEVYNQIKEAISYDEQTNISSNTIALFNVKAFKNMNTSIESLQSRIELLKGRS